MRYRRVGGGVGGGAGGGVGGARVGGVEVVEEEEEVRTAG